jgi:glycosyltransferase involved in cell wall biosynthesis
VTVYGRTHHVDPALDGTDYRGVRLRVLPTIRSKYFDTVVHAWLSSFDCVRGDFDVVLMCNAANSLACMVPRAFGKKVALNLDGIERRRRKWNRLGKAYYRLGEWAAVKIADVVVADAQVVADYYREYYAATPVVIPYGGDPTPAASPATLARFGLQPGRYVLYVSRLEPENNADVVIRAFRGLTTDLRLAIVGDAPYAHAYKQHLRELAASDSRIVFTGYQFGADYHALQQHAACYVQATEVGGTHPALVEAMGAGHCVMANATPENLEVIGDAGLPYRRNDSDDLRAQLQRVLGDPALAAEYGHRAAARVAERYNWDVVTTQYEQLFRRLLAR